MIHFNLFVDDYHFRRWAFVDFTSIDHATAALVNPKNHHLDGRNLVVEYASAEAVRRGGGGPRPKKIEGGGRGSSTKKWDSGLDHKKKDESTRPRITETTETTAGVTEGTVQRQQAQSRLDHPPHENSGSGVRKGGPKDRVSRNRTKPGAALALAKRESAAIIPSQGKKIKF
jgi:RNA recognition motif-containing protein